MTRKPPQDGHVDRLYNALRSMSIGFELKPDERINESELAEALGTSRTPLREALNRLVAEGYLAFRPGHGFFCRGLSPSEVFDLYDARVAIEAAADYLTSADMPLVYGMSNTTCEAQRECVALADQLGGLLDSHTSL